MKEAPQLAARNRLVSARGWQTDQAPADKTLSYLVHFRDLVGKCNSSACLRFLLLLLCLPLVLGHATRTASSLCFICNKICANRTSESTLAGFPAHKLRALIPGRPPRRLTRLEPPFWRLSTESTESCFERSTTPSCSQSTGLSAWAADGSSSGGLNSKLLSALLRFGWESPPRQIVKLPACSAAGVRA